MRATGATLGLTALAVAMVLAMTVGSAQATQLQPVFSSGGIGINLVFGNPAPVVVYPLPGYRHGPPAYRFVPAGPPRGVERSRKMKHGRPWQSHRRHWPRHHHHHHR